jgi:ATP-binding cassette subfamily C protein
MSSVLHAERAAQEHRYRSRNDPAIDAAMSDIEATLNALQSLAISPGPAPQATNDTRAEARSPAPVRPQAPQQVAIEPDAQRVSRIAEPAMDKPQTAQTAHVRDAVEAKSSLAGTSPAAPSGPAEAMAPRSRPSEPVAPGARPAEAQRQPVDAPKTEPGAETGPQAKAEQHANAEPQAKARDDARITPPSPNAPQVPGMGPLLEGERSLSSGRRTSGDGGGPGTPPGGGGDGGGGRFHKRAEMPNFAESFQRGLTAVRRNIAIVMVFTLATNILVLAIPIYLFQISDRVLTSRSVDTLVMLTIAVVGAVVLQAVLDAIRRFILMRTAVEIEVQLGAPVLSAAARSSLNGTSKDYHVLGDLQQLRSFITSGTLISILDAPLAPLFILAVFLIHPHLGLIVIGASLALLVFATINQKLTARHFSDANGFLSRATLHLDSMSRNAQIINALAMIPEAVKIWGRDTALSLRAQVRAQDRNIIIATFSKSFRMLTQVAMLGWGAYLALAGEMTGGMVIAASIIAARALTPIEGAIEGWHHFTQFRASFRKIRTLLQSSPFNAQRLLLPQPQGRLDVERVLYVPPPTKKVILNGISFSLAPGESMAVIGNSGAGKTTLGKMLVGSILPTSGNVRLDLMDLRNWDMRQFGESIGYLPQDVQLFPGTIKANIARMREDASDADIFAAAVLADVHEMIATFPQGYETIVSSDGAPLSGGQKQRIALARAFFGNPQMVVLDEPNSNLDSPGEAALAKALVHAKKQGITVVTITQRTALLNYVDKIMILNNGSVSMLGERAKVLKALTQATQGPDGSLPGKE